MGLRTTSTDEFQTNNYCNILNITNAILGATSKINYYKKIPCDKQTKNEMCKNMQTLFEHSYVIPVPQYANIVTVLQNSVMNSLECERKSEIKILYFNYDIIILVLFGIFINYFLIKKFKYQ
jgi:hypothetical protein